MTDDAYHKLPPQEQLDAARYLLGEYRKENPTSEPEKVSPEEGAYMDAHKNEVARDPGKIRAGRLLHIKDDAKKIAHGFHRKGEGVPLQSR